MAFTLLHLHLKNVLLYDLVHLTPKRLAAGLKFSIQSNPVSKASLEPQEFGIRTSTDIFLSSF